MKKLAVIFLFLLSTGLSQAQEKVSPFLPELLAEYPNVRDVTISPDGNELYFTVESYKKDFSFIACMRKKGDLWGKPELATFSGQYHELEPAFSPDGLSLFFVSQRPTDQEERTPKEDFDIWYVSRSSISAPWGEAVHLGEPVNTGGDEFFPSLGSSGNIYFTSARSPSKGKEDIWMSRFENGKYTEPISLGEGINSPGYEFNAWVSPNEQLMVFTAYGRSDDMGGGDLYLSKKNSEGEWGQAVHLEAANSAKIDYCPFIDLQNNLLYFTSERNEIPAFLGGEKDIDYMLELMNTYSNGLGRIYYLPLGDTLTGK